LSEKRSPKTFSENKEGHFVKYTGIVLALAVAAAGLGASRLGMPSAARAGLEVGPGTVIVHSQFGGQIFGFDIDQNGTEGVLSESSLLENGKDLAAVETFNQATGVIVKVVKKLETEDDFLTLGITGTSAGLVEHEHVVGIYVHNRIYKEVSPLDANKFNGTWKPPLKYNDLILGVSRNQVQPNQTSTTNAVLAFQNFGNNNTFVFGTDVAANIFGPVITLTDPTFYFSNEPVVGYDGVTNQAVVASSSGEVGGPAPQIALVDLTTGKVTQFTGILGPAPYHQGTVNGIAVDSADGIAVTTTELDARVEFYNLAKQTGFAVTLPGNVGQLESGTDVEFDAVNKLFLVAQSVSSTGPGSSIQVYDTKGNLVESLNGFSFSNASNVVGTHIALNPSNRSGYVDGPDSGVTEIQSFTY
jgi:hypothetical protein